LFMPGSSASRWGQASNGFGPKPLRRIDFRNCFGMIASVSTFARSSGAAMPRWTVMLRMVYRLAAPWIVSPARWMSLPIPATVLQPTSATPYSSTADTAIRMRLMRLSGSAQRAHVDEVPGERGRRRHRRTHEMGSPAGALASLEIAVRGRCAALARFEPVGVHRQAHRAAGLAPLEAGVEEDAIEPLLLGLRLHQARARHDHRQLDVRRLLPSAHHGGRLAQVFDARIGARTDEYLVDADLGDRRVRLQ